MYVWKHIRGKKRYSKKMFAWRSVSKLGTSTAAQEKAFLAWYENFIYPRVSKDNLLSSIETKGDQSFYGDDDFEDNGSNVGERHAIERNVEDLNLNTFKRTKLGQWESKKNVKNSKDLEEIEIIKELPEEMQTKQKKQEESEFV